MVTKTFLRCLEEELQGYTLEHLCPHVSLACLLFYLLLQLQGPVQWGFALPQAAVALQLL